MSILERNGGVSFEKKFTHLMDDKLLDFSKVELLFFWIKFILSTLINLKKIKLELFETTP